MCVIYFAFQHRPDHPLILLANRDEYYSRPSVAAAPWEGNPSIFGGRDLVGGGSWLGVTQSGRIAAVTNYRDPTAAAGLRSRGDLVAGFLSSEISPKDYLERLVVERSEYSGFNLLLGTFGENSEFFYYSNRGPQPCQLAPGIYGLSNHLLDTSWPKVESGKARFTEVLKNDQITDEDLFGVLSDEKLADDGDLPSTGISYEAEKALSAIFIKSREYGTRCSSVIKMGEDRQWSFNERIFG